MEQTEKGLQLNTAVTKLDESIQELDETVQSYGQVLESYRQDEASRQRLETAVDDVVTDFETVFNDQNWVGEITAEITDAEPENSYQKFIAYQGLVRATDQLEEPDNSQLNRPSIHQNRGNVRDQREEILETWETFFETYEQAIDLENLAREVSLEEGRESEGLDPYAIDTPFSVLEEEDYERVSDLNECVNASYR